MLVAIRDYPANLHQSRHAHDTMAVTLVLADALRERVGRREEIARPLSLVIKPPGVEHENTFGPAGVRTLQLQFDPREAAALGDANRALGHWHWIHDGTGVRPFLALARALRGGDVATAELAAVDALAGVGAGMSERIREPREPPLAVRLARDRLDDEPRPPAVRHLAGEAGVHPVYLARLFRRHVGTTMARYLRRARIRRVIGRLGSGSLSRASYEAGFADHAHMCRAFRAVTGMTPTEYRALLVELA